MRLPVDSGVCVSGDESFQQAQSGAPCLMYSGSDSPPKQKETIFGTEPAGDPALEHHLHSRGSLISNSPITHSL